MAMAQELADVLVGWVRG